MQSLRWRRCWCQVVSLLALAKLRLAASTQHLGEDSLSTQMRCTDHIREEGICSSVAGTGFGGCSRLLRREVS
jgi:hypothetical protein